MREEAFLSTTQTLGTKHPKELPTLWPITLPGNAVTSVTAVGFVKTKGGQSWRTADACTGVPRARAVLRLCRLLLITWVG